jgi:hypothetical protein
MALQYQYMCAFHSRNPLEKLFDLRFHLSPLLHERHFLPLLWWSFSRLHDRGQIQLAYVFVLMIGIVLVLRYSGRWILKKCYYTDSRKLLHRTASAIMRSKLNGWFTKNQRNQNFLPMVTAPKVDNSYINYKPFWLQFHGYMPYYNEHYLYTKNAVGPQHVYVSRRKKN